MENKARRIIGSITRPPNSLSDAVAHLLAEFSKIESAAGACRVMKSTLAGYANPNQKNNHAPVDVIADLEKAADRPIVSEFLASQLGYSLYKLPGNTGREEMDWNLHFRLIVKETSDVFLSTSDALQDGNISTLEARSICIEIEEALAVFVTFKKALEEKHFHTENETDALRA